MKAISVAAGCAALATFAAGCGGGNQTPTVARLGTSTSSSSTAASAGTSGSAQGGAESKASGAIAYSACIRAHGVPNFPDPKISVHGNETRIAIGINPSISGNPHFNSAQRACRKLQPGGGPGEGGDHQVTPQEQSQFLKAAACIRSHGIANFPDPTFSGGGVHLPKAAGLDPGSPQVRAAEEACQALIPGGLHGDH